MPSFFPQSDAPFLLPNWYLPSYHNLMHPFSSLTDAFPSYHSLMHFFFPNRCIPLSQSEALFVSSLRYYFFSEWWTFSSNVMHSFFPVWCIFSHLMYSFVLHSDTIILHNWGSSLTPVSPSFQSNAILFHFGSFFLHTFLLKLME